MRLFMTALLAGVSLTACGLLAGEQTGPQAQDTVEVAVRGPAGEQHTFTVEVAADPSARRRGLMERSELPPDRGMLFVFPADTASGFWMKNTLIPLSIAFVDADGTVVAVLDMEPCTADPCPTYRPGATYRSALEVPQGALGDAGPGWRLEIDGTLPPVS